MNVFKIGLASVLLTASCAFAQDEGAKAPAGLFGTIVELAGGIEAVSGAASDITFDYVQKAWRDAKLPEDQLPSVQKIVNEAVGAALQDGRDTRQALDNALNSTLDIVAGIAGNAVEQALLNSGFPANQIPAARKLVEENLRALLAPGADPSAILDKTMEDLVKIAIDAAGDAIAETLKKAGFKEDDAKAAKKIATDLLTGALDPKTDTGKALQKAGDQLVDLAQKIAGDTLERNLVLAGISKEQAKLARKIFDDNFASLRKDGTFDAQTTDNLIKLASGLAGDAAENALLKAGFSKEDAAKSKKLVKEVVSASLKGDKDLGDVIRDNIASYVLDKIEGLVGAEGRALWQNAWNEYLNGGDVWASVSAAAMGTLEIIAFKELEKIVDAQLESLLAKNPFLKDIFDILGINTGSIMQGIKNIWGVLTGPGSLQDKLQQLVSMAADALKAMVQKLIDWGVQEISKMINKLISEIGQKIRDFVGNLLGNFKTLLGGLYEKFCQACLKLEQEASKKIAGVVEEGGKVLKNFIDGKPAGQETILLQE